MVLNYLTMLVIDGTGFRRGSKCLASIGDWESHINVRGRGN